MRIVAGALRGRRLFAPRGSATRPTADRVRQALFDVLGDVSGAVVLDLWAGTGALGLEALSRGARTAVLVESARPAREAISRNVRALGLEARVTLMSSTVERAAPRLAPLGPFDLVFADPPWDDWQTAVAALTTLLGALAVAPEGRVVVEHAATEPAPELAGYTAADRRRWGGTRVAIFTRAA